MEATKKAVYKLYIKNMTYTHTASYTHSYRLTGKTSGWITRLWIAPQQKSICPLVGRANHSSMSTACLKEASAWCIDNYRRVDSGEVRPLSEDWGKQLASRTASVEVLRRGALSRSLATSLQASRERDCDNTGNSTLLVGGMSDEGLNEPLDIGASNTYTGK